MATVQQRPNQQMQAQPRRRILRIGILLGGKIIEERLIRERTSVTIGQSAKNTFSVAIEQLPREWSLFTLHGEQYSLHFMNGMDGRLSDGGQVYTLDALKQHRARQTGDGWVLPLSDQSRGKVSIGDLTLLFQFVTEPPKQPRPMLPASVRGTFADRIDPRLAVSESLSIVLCFMVYIWAVVFNDPAHELTVAEQAYNRTFKPETTTVQTFDVPQQPTDTGNTPQKAPDKGQDKPKEPPKKPAGGDKGQAKAPDKSGGRDKNDAVALQEEAVRYADSLFSDDEAKTGLTGGMDRRKPGTDLGDQMKEVQESGAKVEVGGGTGRGTRGDGEARTGTGKGPQLNGQTGVQGQDKGPERVPSGRITTTEKQAFDESSLTADAVLAKIMQAYMAGLKRCHKDLLKTDPTARGKVTLSFTVGESGRVSKANVAGFNDSLDSCIQARVESWRFAEPKDKDGEKTTADFKITLQLVPE
jgi:outer membrane biosynthesis protein TonB